MFHGCCRRLGVGWCLMCAIRECREIEALPRAGAQITFPHFWLHVCKVFPYLKLWKIPSHQPQPVAPLSSAPLARRQSPDMVIIAFTKEMTTFGTLSLNMSVCIFHIATSPNRTENIKYPALWVQTGKSSHLDGLLQSVLVMNNRHVHAYIYM